MSPLEVVASAFRAIRANVTRALLTLLGVLIGVGSVILLLGVGQRVAYDVTGRIASMGAETITVAAGSSAGTGARQRITAQTAQALANRQAAPDIAVVVPVIATPAVVTAGARSQTASLVGTSEGYFEATNSPLDTGTGFTAVDNLAARDVCVLGTTLAQKLFPDTDAVGQQVSINGRSFLVYGVLKDKDTISGGTNASVIAPIERVQRSLTGFGDLSQIVLQADSPASVPAALAQAKAIIAAQLGVAPAELTVNVTSQAQLQSAIAEVGDKLAAMLAAIAAISLVVGGIGVMNIMLVTVSERTREIGIRKALGAPRGAIAIQFLTEATVLSLLGGGFGVLTAWAFRDVSIMGVVPVIGRGPILLAFGVSVAIGVVFGGYPAIRASGMRPVDALRHD
jgi:putative ABC transport system permease protein